MESYARVRGFADSALHKAAKSLLLRPRQWLDSHYVAVTITLEGLWVEDRRVATLRCSCRSGKRDDKCRSSMSRCAHTPLSSECIDEGFRLLPENEKKGAETIAALEEPVSEKLKSIGELLRTLARSQRYGFVIFVDDAVPFELVARTLYTIWRLLPDNHRGKTRFEFPGRPPSGTFAPTDQVTATLPAPHTPPLDKSRRKVVAQPASVLLDRKALILRAIHDEVEVERKLPGVTLKECAYPFPQESPDWLGLHRALLDLKKGHWARQPRIYLGTADLVPWRLVADGISSLGLVRRIRDESCGLNGTEFDRELFETPDGDKHPRERDLFPEVILLLPWNL